MATKSPALFLMEIALVAQILAACSEAAGTVSNKVLGTGSAVPSTEIAPSPTARTAELLPSLMPEAPLPSDSLFLKVTIAPAAPSSTPNLETYHRQATRSESPIEQLVAHVVISYPESPDGTVIGNQYHSKVLIIDFQTGHEQVVVDEWREFEQGFTTPFVLGWSADGSHLYIADQSPTEGCGPNRVDNLRSYDVETGQAAQIPATVYLSPGISPGGNILASTGEDGLHVFDLTTSEEMIIPFEQPDGEWLPGTPIWSPDGGRWLLFISHDPCGSPDESSGSLISVDLDQRAARTLVEHDPRRLKPASWPLDDLAQLVGSDGSTWWLTVSTGETSAVPPGEVGQAWETLFAYLEALRSEDYEVAANLYGGGYDILRDWDPSTDPNDRVALLQSGCQILLCDLPIGSTVLADHNAPGEYLFQVTFLTDSGETFVRGPCCGASVETMPALSSFPYTVRRDASGKFVVLGLGIYMP